MEFSSLIGWWKLDGIYFVFFFPPAKKEETPTHIAAHFQAHTSLRSAQRLAKELQYPNHTTTTTIHSLCYVKKRLNKF